MPYLPNERLSDWNDRIFVNWASFEHTDGNFEDPGEFTTVFGMVNAVAFGTKKMLRLNRSVFKIIAESYWRFTLGWKTDG